MHVLAFMLYIQVCLLRSRFCHAWCPPWACACWSLGPLACVVASVLLVACFCETICETHLCDVGLLDTYTSPLCAIICLPCLLCATRLALLVSLHLCTLAYLFMHESLCLLVSLSLIPTILCGFTLVFDTRDLESLLGILLNGKEARPP